MRNTCEDFKAIFNLDIALVAHKYDYLIWVIGGFAKKCCSYCSAFYRSPQVGNKGLSVLRIFRKLIAVPLVMRQGSWRQVRECITCKGKTCP